MKSYFITAVLLVTLMIAVFGLGSCAKRSLVPAKPTPDSTITDTIYYIDITLEQKRVFEISNRTANWTWSPPWYMIGDTSIYPYSSLQCEFGEVPDGSVHGFYFSKNAYGLDMGKYFSSKDWWDPLMKETFIDSFFQAGDYSYATLLNRDTTYTSPLNPDATRPRTQKLLSSGIHLIWYDGTGKFWQTCSGTADQTGSYFTITKRQAEPFTFQPGYEDYVTAVSLTAKFECNLYDGEGHVLHVSNGKFRLRMRFKQFN